MKKLIFRIGAVIIFGIIITATVITSIRDNGWGSYSRTSAEITGGEPSVKFGQVSYNKLTRPQQYIYDSIIDAVEDGFSDLTEEMPFVAQIEDVTLAVDALKNDCPEYFYIDAEKFSLGEYYYVEVQSDDEETTVTEYRGDSIKNGKYTVLQVHYTDTKEELAKKKTRLDAAVSKAMSLIDTSKSDIERLTLLHDYIAEICEKAENTTPENVATVSNAYGALVDGCADAVGYHKALKLLLNKAEMVSHIVNGSVKDRQSVWCVVLVDDKYYNTDVYEDDLDSKANGETMRGVYTHAYLNVSDAVISSTHTNKEQNAPKCTDNETYYTLSSLQAAGQGAVDGIVDRQMKSFVKYKKNYIEICCDFEPDETFLAEAVRSSFLEEYTEYTPQGVRCTVIKPFAQFNAYTVRIEYEIVQTPEETV